MGYINRALLLYMWVLIGLMLISYKIPFSSADTDLRDVAAVNALFVALGYPPLTGWILVGGDPCGEKWQGVECVFTNITAIRLSGTNSGGQLGDTLGSFESIMEIDLSNNHIGGSFPIVLPPTLRNLSLSSNLLTGGIPDAFQLLSGLTTLDISGNNLTSQLPPSMGSLSLLSKLHLQNNQLSGTLDVLQNLPLTDLNIENNLFSGPIPPKLLTIPNFRKDGNPFNSTIIPTPTAPSPSPLARTTGPFTSAIPPASIWAIGPSGSETLKSNGSKKFFTANKIIWIAIIGVVIVVALVLCLCTSRYVIGRKERQNTQRYENGVFNSSSEKPNYSEVLPPQRKNDIEKGEPKETVLKPADRLGMHNGRTNLTPKVQDKKERDERIIASASSPHRKDHEIMDTSSTDDNFLPPPPPLPPFLVEKPINSKLTAQAPTSRCPTKIVNSSCREIFSVATLQLYTNSFSEENFIGTGMLGSVYKAELPSGKMLAVKKLDTTASRWQSDEEFLELVSNISKIHHTNIVELVGYCFEHGQRLLVYEYCKNGTLFDALHMDEEIHRKLSWNMRIRAALGVARALEYLHEVCNPPIMHRNLKSGNLLFDDELKVRVSDCGLAPLLSYGSANQLSGYGAPEFELGSYTYQSDVYSFGVVMLEILTGRKACDRSRPKGEQFLVRWAIHRLHDINTLSKMVDPSLNGIYPVKSLSRFADIISSCVQSEPEFRPQMSEIVQELLQML